jgi:hypothetical protein
MSTFDLGEKGSNLGISRKIGCEHNALNRKNIKTRC